MTIFEARDLTVREREPAGPEEASSSVRWFSLGDLRALLADEEAIDGTTAIALHRLFGNFFDR
jgi:hypothetical protein